MSGRRLRAIWWGRLIAVVIVAALAVFLFTTGLGEAAQFAAVLSLLVAVAALVAPYLLPNSKAVTRSVASGGGDLAESMPPVRSAYLEQVRQIAPPVLHGRASEMNELYAFCGDSAPASYVWWRAPAWSGKSALMSWFVLNPPPGARMVSFFVTARYAGQDNRGAFTDVVMEQLAELLGQPMPACLTEATRESHLLRMLTEAARQCGRLVLVVDGLDEDRGVVAGVDAHSIAALLPSRPPDGLRVIVAGRLDPPLPPDVPSDHPLRDPAIVRTLGGSQWATVAAEDMRRELRRLLHGPAALRDLLGMVTAAGGGLSAHDLADLTGLPPFEVTGNLETVSGRTFTSRLSGWQPGTAPPVYVLGHEELQKIALEDLGDQLAGYRERLRDWAASYLGRGWPEETPEYLLRGYFRMLHATHDIPGMIRLATDRQRQDRMLDISGGDTAAFTEITETQDAILAHDAPDLVALARLATCRKHLELRNVDIPLRLPGLWARLGHPTRGLALANGLRPGSRSGALAYLAEAIAVTGDLDMAEEVARTLPGGEDYSLYSRATAFIAIVAAAARRGDLGRVPTLAAEAESAVRAISNESSYRRELQIMFLEAAAATGHRDLVEARMRDLTAELSGHWTVGQMRAVVRALAEMGDLDQAEDFTRAQCGPGSLHDALADLTEAAVAAGDHDRARRLAGETEIGARAVTDPADRADALVAAVRAAAVAGILGLQPGLAEEATRAINAAAAAAADRFEPQEPSMHLIAAVAAVGDLAQAETLAQAFPYEPWQRAVNADRISGLAHVMHLSYYGGFAFDWLAKAVARGGGLEYAAKLADTASSIVSRGRLFRVLAELASDTGDRRQAGALLDEAEAVMGRSEDLISLALVAAGASDKKRAHRLALAAEAVAYAVTSPDQEAATLACLAEAMASGGDVQRARLLAGKAAVVAREISDPAKRRHTLIRALAAMGELTSAETLLRTEPGVFADAESTARLAVAAGRAGDISRARALIQAADEASTGTYQAEAICTILIPAAAVTDPEWAQTLARRVQSACRGTPEPLQRVYMLTALVDVVADMGDFAWAQNLVREAEAAAADTPEPHSYSLLGLAQARLASPEHARTLIARVLTGTDLSTVIGVLAKVQPAVATAIVDDYLRATTVSSG
jgi:hypothetical protein